MVKGAGSCPVQRLTYVFPFLRKDCLADVTADGGGQERRTGAHSKVVSRSVLDEDLLPSARLLSLTFM